MTDDFDDPDFDWAAWSARINRQVKQMFVIVVITELTIIVAFIRFGSWFLLPVPIFGLGVAIAGRYILYLRDQGRLASMSCCPNCGEPGDPNHHWLSQPGTFEGYICFGADAAISDDELDDAMTTFEDEQ